MLKRQAAGPQISDPATVSASMKFLAQVYSNEPDIGGQFCEKVVTTGWKGIEERQQMQWAQKGDHFLLQIRTKVLDGDLEGVFRGWYLQFLLVLSASP